MAFQKSFQHVGLAGKGTLAEVQAWLATLTPTVRAQHIGCTVEITDKGEQTLWVVDATGLYPIKDLVPDYIQDVSATYSIQLEVDESGVLTGGLKTRSAGALDVTAQGVGVRTGETISTTVSINANNEIVSDVKVRNDQYNALQSKPDGLDVNLSGSTTTTTGVTPVITEIDGDKSSSFLVNVLLNEAADNAVQVGSSANSLNGLYVKKLTIDPASVGLLSIDAENRLKLERQAVIDVIVDNASTSVADFIANVLPTSGASTGDFIYIPNAPKDERGYIVKTSNPATLADLIPVEYPDYTQAQIRGMLSAQNGVGYNSATGVFYGVADPNGRNDLTVGADGFKVDVFAAASAIAGGIGNVSLTDNLAELYSRLATLNAVTYENLITKTGSKVELGGVATKNTSMDLADKVMSFTSAATGGVKFATNNVAFLDKFYIKNELGEWLEMKVNGANFWSPSPVASIPF